MSSCWPLPRAQVITACIIGYLHQGRIAKAIDVLRKGSIARYGMDKVWITPDWQRRSEMGLQRRRRAAFGPGVLFTHNIVKYY